jgi:hypothetical protein
MKAHRGTFKVTGAFQAAARPLYAGAVCRQPRLGQTTGTAPEGANCPSLAELAEGPYFVLALLLDATTLCCTDATCRLLRQLNRARIGPWRALGTRVFHGLELEREGIFEQPANGPEPDRGCNASSTSGRKLARIDWKGRFHHFRTDVPTFCAPFGGPEITAVAHPDEVAYFRCRLCTDILDEKCTHGVYLEVEVLSNPDNLSMAVVDFEAGGCSSVTFSPDTGAVIRERKVREAPRKVEGAYIQPLPTVPPGRRFHGLMGLYLNHGRLAFFRRCDSSPPAAEEGHGHEQPPAPQRAGNVARRPEDAQSSPSTGVADGMELGPWETTGFVSDLGWAEGRRLTPCLAFRDEGAYRVRVVSVGTLPPLPPERWNTEGTEGESGWSGFDWEVGAPTLPDAADA